MKSREDFLGRFWPGTATSVQGPLERLGALASLPELADVYGVVEAFKDPVMVILPDERDESSTLKVDGGAALGLYGQGMALCFSSVDKFIPEVDRWLQALRRELGLPSATYARALVYAAKPGAGNFPHYDANANFVVQLQGTKRWTLAPNTHVVNPTDRWTMTSPHLPAEVNPEVEMPRRMPADALSIDLVPGSVLFVPRGYWHATEVGSEDTLALNFTYSQPTWAEVVTAVMLNRLHREPEFRRLADGLESKDSTRQAAARAELSRMVDRFKGEAACVDGEAVFAELMAAALG